MAKRCEICGKGPVVGRQISHAHNVSPRRFDPNLQTVRAMINGGSQAHSRLHALPAIEQGRQSRVGPARVRCQTDAMAAAHVLPTNSNRSPRGTEGDRSLLLGRCGLASSSSSPVRCRSIPRPGNMVDGDIAVQTRRVLDNIGALLKAGGLSFADVVRTTVFLADMNDFAAMNEVYRTFFSEPYPARVDRAGSAAAAGRADRDRRDRQLRDGTGRRGSVDRSDGLPGPAGAFHVQHAVHRLQRLDHLLEVLEIADLDRHVDPRALIVVVGARFHVLDVGIDVGDLRADRGQHPLPILDLHRQLDRVAAAASAPASCPTRRRCAAPGRRAG